MSTAEQLAQALREVHVITAAVAHEDELRAITRLQRLELLLKEMLAQHEAQQAEPEKPVLSLKAKERAALPPEAIETLQLSAEWWSAYRKGQADARARLENVPLSTVIAQQAQAAEPVAEEIDGLLWAYVSAANDLSDGVNVHGTMARMVALKDQIAALYTAPPVQSAEPVGVVLALNVCGEPMPNSTGVEWLRPVPLGAKLYTAPPVRELTDDEIADMSLQFVRMEPLSDFDYIGFARALLAAAGGAA